MFLRRNKLKLHRRLQEFLWPSIGWRRAGRYVWHRLARLPGTPYSLAAGLACGSAISFTPFVGLHFVLAALLAWSMRANLVASAIGTAVGNPWTFPFIWVWIYRAGVWMGAGPATAPGQDHVFSSLFGALMTAVLRLDFANFIDKFWPIWWPMLVGSLPTAVVAWWISYVLTKPLIATYQHRRVVRRARNRQVAEHVAAVPGKEVQG